MQQTASPLQATGAILGQTKNKFNLRNPRKELQIVEDQFFRWTNTHHYRTSSNDMLTHVSHCYDLFILFQKSY